MRAAIPVTLLSLARRFEGLREVPGTIHNPQVLAMLQLVTPSVHDDETPWCGAFVNYCCWILGVEGSGSLAARSWLKRGQLVAIEDAQPGFDVVIFQRGAGPQPGPEVLAAPGHVAIFVRDRGSHVEVIGGNQGNSVSTETFPKSRILGIRRL